LGSTTGFGLASTGFGFVTGAAGGSLGDMDAAAAAGSVFGPAQPIAHNMSQAFRRTLPHSAKAGTPKVRAGAVVYPRGVPAPTSETELIQRARALAGEPLGNLAASFGIDSPPDLRRAKGWAGGLIERALGAESASRAQPDFPELGVELKTLPVDRRGRPCESTFVCTIDLGKIGEVEWETSLVHHKLARVLWIPIQGDRDILPKDRLVGEPLLWSPSPEEAAELRFDWEELAGIIGNGNVEQITGHGGRWLQVRPKAADSHARRRGRDDDGVSFAALPRGFYLRASFTQRILERAYVLPVP
jgi:DNA mismatch repair protein MutH